MTKQEMQEIEKRNADPAYRRWSYGLPVLVEELDRRYGQSVSFRVSGDPEKVREWAENYQRDYHPFGYGTTFTWENANTLRSWRSHTCD